MEREPRWEAQLGGTPQWCAHHSGGGTPQLGGTPVTTVLALSPDLGGGAIRRTPKTQLELKLPSERVKPQEDGLLRRCHPWPYERD